MLMLHTLVNFFVSSFVLPCAYAYVATEDLGPVVRSPVSLNGG